MDKHVPVSHCALCGRQDGNSLMILGKSICTECEVLLGVPAQIGDADAAQTIREDVIRMP